MSRHSYSVDPRCYSVKMADGTEYPVNDGRLSIDSERHATELSTSDQVRLGFIHRARAIYTGCPGKVCNGCGFHAHGFSAKCPRCGGVEFTED